MQCKSRKDLQAECPRKLCSPCSALPKALIFKGVSTKAQGQRPEISDGPLQFWYPEIAGAVRSHIYHSLADRVLLRRAKDPSRMEVVGDRWKAGHGGV